MQSKQIRHVKARQAKNTRSKQPESQSEKPESDFFSGVAAVPRSFPALDHDESRTLPKLAVRSCRERERGKAVVSGESGEKTQLGKKTEKAQRKVKSKQASK